MKAVVKQVDRKDAQQVTTVRVQDEAGDAHQEIQRAKDHSDRVSHALSS
jgi:hypothetical protein